MGPDKASLVEKSSFGEPQQPFDRRLLARDDSFVVFGPRCRWNVRSFGRALRRVGEIWASCMWSQRASEKKILIWPSSVST